MIVGARAEDVPDGVPGERPDDGLVGVLDDARLLVLAHVPEHDGAIAAAAGEGALVNLGAGRVSPSQISSLSRMNSINRNIYDI